MHVAGAFRLVCVYVWPCLYIGLGLSVSLALWGTCAMPPGISRSVVVPVYAFVHARTRMRACVGSCLRLGVGPVSPRYGAVEGKRRERPWRRVLLEEEGSEVCIRMRGGVLA